ncbi:hypothetical protein K2Y11_18950 [bacterium]|nr:hypothetical protein [bacterium]
MSPKKKKKPEQPQKLRTKVSRSPDELTVVYSSRSFSVGMFLLFFLCFWTLGCVLLIYKVLENPELMRILFGSVFWVSWIFVFVLMIASIFGCDFVRVDKDSLTYINRVIFVMSRRQIPLSELRRISVEYRKQNSDDSPTIPLIVIETLGSPITLCSGVPIDELEWLVSELIEATGLGDRIEVPDEPVHLQGKSFESTLSIVEKPSECTWQMRQDFDGLVFFQRGTFSFLGLLVILFIVIFWNGIVSVFLLNLFGFDGKPPRGLEWIWQALFLIPFILIGLLFVFLLLLAILEPLRVTSWTFTSNSIDCAWRWLGIGPRWHYDVDRLHGITIEKSKRRNPKENEESDDGPLRYCIIFHADESAEICKFDSLTEGEARWIAENARRVLPIS